MQRLTYENLNENGCYFHLGDLINEERECVISAYRALLYSIIPCRKLRKLKSFFARRDYVYVISMTLKIVLH